MKAPFDLRQLRYFVAVAEAASFRRAAERLFVSQPPLSRQIRALEEGLGVRLFERSTAAVRLTREGERALARARRLIADAEALAEEMGRLAGERATRIGVSVAVGVKLRARLAAAWKRALATDRLQVEYAETTALLPRLRRGQLDYALAGAVDDGGELGHEVVHTVPLRAVLPRDHPAARKALVRLADLADSPFFWLPRRYNPAYYERCAKVFARSRFAPRFVTVEPGQLVTMQRIAAGEGCTLMSLAQLETPVRGVVHRPLAEGESLGIPLVALWRRDRGREGEALGRAFARAAKQVLGGRKAS